MPWHEYRGHRFWFAEHKSDGVVIFSERVSCRANRDDVVYLYISRDRHWQEYDKQDVRNDLLYGETFQARNPNWSQHYDGWNDAFNAVEFSARFKDEVLPGGSASSTTCRSRQIRALPIEESLGERLTGWGDNAVWSPYSEEGNSSSMEKADWGDSLDDFDNADWEEHYSEDGDNE